MIKKTFKLFSTLQQGQTETYDIIISGCGPVGLSFACALSNSMYFKNQKAKILMLDSQKLEENLTDIPHQRVYSINYSSQNFLQSIGAWDHLDKKRLGHTKQMQVWEEKGQSYIKFKHQGSPNDDDNKLGTLIENNNIILSLLKRIRELNTIEFSIPDQIECLEDDENSNLQIVKLKSGRKMFSKLVVGSDGRNSVVKEQKKIGTYGWMYNQMGIVCTIKTSKSEKNTAYQRYFINGSSLAILPLWDGYSSIVYSVPLYQYEELIKQSDNDFLNTLNFALSKQSNLQTPTFNFNDQSFVPPPFVTQIINKRLAFPLAQLQSGRYIARNIALIGDAAHSIHPHGGQGLNNGFNDAISLSNCVIRNFRAGHFIGDLMSLQEYESEAKVFNYFNGISMEVLKKLYEVDVAGFAMVRNFGANLLNNCNFIKNNIQKIAGQNPFAPQKYEWID
ncbi:ubiquinone biosynthesis coq6 family protein, putative [Ichthyophthirius multifiliis]|uniref:Ubiquinone biosynthesis coq6 family protein, putative n=1 Tax=Ichthyophthirius multifiliis TaxID=5932 RepID=G0R590_ICHMU|nr:ubiquinone biosynthesis coq6 family protein, putative [Ichthyophthirius multifiliis]EGR27367.1 ubiquinone biosynthesis coq6 family protein, putative [Ichthyophthirius multifiliis]|eukprot:XP_004024251.1 ubiquinone biosynthesis coq6 family protein, putative [Ichthyophthirius multifiliis]